MTKWRTEDTDAFFRSILSLKTLEECYDYFGDVCTATEVREMSKRLKVARLLREGMSYNAVNQMTGVSTATISRVSSCLTYGNQGYDLVLERMGEKRDDRQDTSEA